MERGVIRGVLILIAVIIFVISGMWYLHKQGAPKREAYETLAACMQDRGVIFYGAFWCPLCGEQKTVFGGAAKKLPYVECSTPDRSGRTDECEEAQVRNYPTWAFPSGMRCTGVVDERVLAHLSQCDAPNLDGTVWTPQSLYEAIVVQTVKEQLVRQQVDEAEIETAVQSVTEQMDAALTAAHGTTVATEESTTNMLDVIASAFSRCKVFEPETVEVSDVEVNLE
ncbi:MAG: hypothetical protein OYG31_01380 [Candidatus Kaiserbacteria bacterium]|nr:hypothetical protein [Candidatus Kaiserbacteria bacterium]